MSFHLFIEWFVALLLLATGASHVAQPRLWSLLFTDLLTKPYAGLVIGTFTLPLGLLLVLGHNTWMLGIPVIVTVIGWGWTFKRVLYLLHPAVVPKVANRHVADQRRFVIAGAFIIVVSGVVILNLIMSHATS